MSCDYIPPLPVTIRDEREDWMPFAGDDFDFVYDD